MEDLKKQYNKELERYKKAQVYFENARTPLETRLQYIGNLTEIIKKLELIIARFALNNYMLTEDEIENGFKDEKLWEQDATTLDECKQVAI